MAGNDGTLRVGAAFPDPPFNAVRSRPPDPIPGSLRSRPPDPIPGSLRSRPPDGDGGLDIDLMNAIGRALGRDVVFVHYSGRDFNGIFDALDSGEFDCVTSGTTVTGSRALKAAFCDPYLISGQALAVDTSRLPEVTSIDDLEGLTIGVQQGNTSQPIANRLVADGRAGRVRVYDYGSIRTALRDLSTGRCDAFMKLGPVLTELVRDLPGLRVVQRGITVEKIAIAVPTSDAALLSRIRVAQARLEEDGTLPTIRQRWTGSSLADQSGA